MRSSEEILIRDVRDPARTIPLDNAFNFRDLGGYRAMGGAAVRWRTVFRADGLGRLTQDDGQRLRSLGIASVIDLRTHDELNERGKLPAHAGDVDYYHLPIFDVSPDWSGFDDADRPGFLADRYIEMLESGRSAVRTALELLADACSVPAVFHCAAGKDRTGILAAVLLGLLGVDDDTIVADYGLSEDAMSRMRSHFQSLPEDQRLLRVADRVYPASVIEARPATMVQFLAHVRDRFGSVDGLAADLGVSPDLLVALRARLLVDEAP